MSFKTLTLGIIDIIIISWLIKLVFKEYKIFFKAFWYLIRPF